MIVYKLAIAGGKQAGKSAAAQYLAKRLTRKKCYIYFEGLSRPVCDLGKRFTEEPTEEQIEKIQSFGEDLVSKSIWVDQLEKRIEKTIRYYKPKNKENSPFITLVEDLTNKSYYNFLKKANWDFLLINRPNIETAFKPEDVTYTLNNSGSLDELKLRLDTIVTKILGDFKCLLSKSTSPPK